MVTIKVFDSKGVRELECFDTLLDVPYIVEDIPPEETVEEDASASDDSVDF